jgi:hypothetical protein
VLGQEEEEEGVGTASWRSGKYTVKKLDDFPNIFLQCNFIFSQQNFYEKLV